MPIAKKDIEEVLQGITVNGDGKSLYDGNLIYTIIAENEEVTITNPDDELNQYAISPSYLLSFYKEGYDYQWDIIYS